MTKVRFTALSTVFILALAASTIYAASCCDSANNSGQSFLSTPTQQSARPAATPLQARNNAPRLNPAAVTSMGSGWNAPQNKAYSVPAKSANAPSAPSCCSGANKPAQQQIQQPVAGCGGCCAGGGGCRGYQSNLMQGPAMPAAGPYAQPAAYGYGSRPVPVPVEAAARPFRSGTLW